MYVYIYNALLTVFQDVHPDFNGFLFARSRRAAIKRSTQYVLASSVGGERESYYESVAPLRTSGLLI